MPQNNKKIRVAIIGDGFLHSIFFWSSFFAILEKVGKTSFITTLISESLPEKVFFFRNSFICYLIYFSLKKWSDRFCCLLKCVPKLLTWQPLSSTHQVWFIFQFFHTQKKKIKKKVTQNWNFKWTKKLKKAMSLFCFMISPVWRPLKDYRPSGYPKSKKFQKKRQSSW